MSISLQTNVDSLIAQQNLNTNRAFQSNTIQQLTSGYRINSSADDAAVLAIANGFRSTTTELTQGVQNANNGISTLQIVDGGMNNISQMLDTLRTLSTQSASGTFTGDRGVLNNQFQSLLTEVDRESQSIGLNTGGEFNKSLSVYIGGGTSNTGAFSSANGTVNVDLSGSAVDTQALGLKGMQVVAGSTDLSAASASSVANIVGNASNTTANGGYTELDFAGPGFSDGSQAKVSVNLSGVTDMNSLVSAINNGIQTAGAGNSAAASAFGAAGIVASVHTDASGGQELAFTSSTTAFQVGAGDQMANALMGNIASGSTGTAITSTVAGAATTATGTAMTSPTTVNFQISGGGLTSPITLNLGAGSTTTGAAITDIQSQVASNSALKAAGITLSGVAGGALTFSDSFGNKMNVTVTGDTANNLGFGSFVGDGTSTDAQYSTVTAGAALNTASALGTAQVGFSINGGASNGSNQFTVNLNAGDATAGTTTATNANTDVHGQSISIALDGGAATTFTFAAGSTTSALEAADINTNGGGSVNATVSSAGKLILTAASAGAHSIAVTGAAATALGVTSPIVGTSRSGQSIADALNSGFAASAPLSDAGLQATFAGGKVTVASSNGTSFRVNSGGSGATADIGFGVAGAAYAGATVSSSAATFDDASGVSNSGAQAFSAMKYGNDTQAITISANSSSGALESKTITLQNNATAQTGQSIDSAVAYINKQLQQSNDPTLQSVAAVKEDVGGTEKINFISSLSNFSASFGSSPNGDGFSGAAGTTVASTQNGTAATVSIDTQAGAVQAVAAVANAVSKLGIAQAGVGEGQNQLNYATGLAQSQITNISAAESRIRDADVAQEAANLTKAQTLSQAGIAAMAQANTEGQSILSLLHG